MTAQEKAEFKKLWQDWQSQPLQIYPAPEPPFTRRQQIAIAAMQGILTAHDPEKGIDYREVAKQSDRMATTMLREFAIYEQPPAPVEANGFLPTVD